jgi:hypothetical protein
VLILGTVLVLAACGSDTTAPPPQTPARSAPEISGTTLDGEKLSLSSFRGKPVVVNVWSSW